MGGVTLLDVAAAAGVSRATASRVLAGTDRNVDPALADRVRRASLDLGYRGNAAARMLRTRQARSVGVLVPSLRNPYFVGLVEALSAELSRTGGSLLLGAAEDDPTVEAERLQSLLGSVVDALVVVPTSRDESGPAIAAAARQLPVVQLDRWAHGAEAPFVGLDNVEAVRIALDHLRRRGHRRVLYLGAEEASSTGAERLAAFRALRSADDTELVLPLFSVDAGHEAGRILLGGPPLPDAVLAAADVLAAGLVSTLQQAGVDVPGQVAVTGFDGTDLLELVNPPISTLSHPLTEMSRAALQRLSESDTAGPVPPELRFAPTWLERRST